MPSAVSAALRLWPVSVLFRFDADYHKLPVPSGPAPQGGDRDTDSAPFHSFIAILSCKEDPSAEAQNPKHTDYLEGILPAKKSRGRDDGWANGLISDPATGAYGVVDSYGKPYRIRLDTNHDETLTNPNPQQAAEGRPTLKARVLVWSAGKDGDWNTWDDNPTRLGGFGARAAGSGQRAAGSANGAQHDSLGFQPQENVTTHPRERQRRVPSGVIWMENGDDRCWEHRRALVIHGTRFQRWGNGNPGVETPGCYGMRLWRWMGTFKIAGILQKYRLILTPPSGKTENIPANPRSRTNELGLKPPEECGHSVSTFPSLPAAQPKQTALPTLLSKEQGDRMSLLLTAALRHILPLPS